MHARRPWGTLSPAEQAEHRERAVAAYRRVGSLRGAETALRAEGAEFCSFQFVKQAVKRALKAEMAETPAEAPREYKRTEEGDTASVQYLASRPIRTLEDALAYADVDTTVWRVRRWSATAWQSGMKLRTFDDKGKVAAEQPFVQDLWRVSMDLERILPKPWLDATEAIIRRMEQHAPQYPAPPARQRPKDPHLLELDLFDVHFGKLAWKPETGNDYDLRIAEAVYKNAVLDLLDRAAGFAIDEILLPIGNDFFHVDSLANTTTAGTPQDVDGRYAKMIEVGTLAVIWAIETLMAVAPVGVLLVPGNHDRLTSLHLAREIAAWFRSCDRVTVDYAPTDRKYRRYGENLLGFAHGNEEKHADLPVIMAVEQPEAWAQTRYREFHVGHFHRARELRTMPLETHGGVGVRFLRSLSGVDAWHARRGYTGSQRAAECYLWGQTGGLAGHFTANARTS